MTTTETQDTETHAADPEDLAPVGWQGITDDGLAAWALNKIAEAEAERERIRRNAQAWIEQIQRDAAADEKPLADRIDWFTGQLIAYYDQLPDPPATYKLPNGQIARRKGRPSTRVTEPNAFTTWATEHHPAALKVAPLVSGIPSDWPRTSDGQIITPDGEPVPGVEVQMGEPTISVKATGAPS